MASGPWLLLLVCLHVHPSRCQEDAPCAFNTMCSCKMAAANTSHVSCLGVPLLTFPELPGGEVALVDIVDSGLEALESEALGDARIESLRLMSNRLEFVGNRAFSSSVSVLKSLDLSYNQLSEVPFESLQHLQALDWLSLHSNQIATLQGQAESSWGRLKDTLTNVYLGDNDLTELPRSTQPHENIEAPSRRDGSLSDSLLGLRSVTLLNVDSNKLSSLDPGTLPVSLETLSASQNLIVEFPAQSLDELHRLSWLNLRSNCIRELKNYSFKHLKFFEKLDLGDNALNTLPSSVFNITAKVRDLSLDLNYLEFIPAQAFNGMDSVRLNLAKNRLSSIHERSFEGLELSLEYITLEDNELQEIPTALGRLKRLKYFYIASNNISDIQSDVFVSFCTTLKALSLSSNYISTVPQKSLEKCKKLSHLNLAYNQIYDIETKDFYGFGTSLETLLLCGNIISALGPHIFLETPVLRELSLSFNFLSELDPESLSDLANTLESLEISFGLFSEDFPESFLRPLKSLVWLALDNNKFRTISPTALISFQKLEYLNLESNRLVELPPDMFRTSTFVKLRDIRLSYNLLSVIESRTFSSLPNLQTLVLTGNRIKTIKSSGFHNVTRLSTIILSDNQLVSIEDKAFYDLPNLGRLDMQNNKLEYFTLNIFERVATELVPFRINVSRNMITYLYSTRNFSMLSVTVFDVTHNKVFDIPDDYFYKFNKTLRQLYMGHNNIRQLRSETFGSLTSVECLTLEHNHISSIHKSTFHALASLQVLDLSHNHVRQLQARQLAGLGRLRVVRLSHNQLRALPRDVFAGSPLERLDLSGNKFAALPAGALGAAGRTLRQLRMADNAVERVDGTALFDTPRLLELDLARNGLASLPDNLLAGVAGLQRLDLSGNRLRANFRELFHFAQRLRHLRAAGMGLAAMLPLPLPALLSLDVSDNLIAEVSPAAVGRLASLRTLSLRNNRLTSVPAHAWVHTPLLKSLDISGNPLKSLTKDSFSGLSRLQHLDIQRLATLQRLDAGTLAGLPRLWSVRLEARPGLGAAQALARAPSLGSVAVEVSGRELGDQLQGAFHRRLCRLHVTGPDLAAVRPGALRDLGDRHELELRFRGTRLDSLPAGLVASLRRVGQLTLDIGGNQFSSLSPASLYANGTDWENIGTRLVAGGLVVKDNPWVCDCDLVWLGQWLRRWLRETAQVHTMALDDAHLAQLRVREAICRDKISGKATAIVDLYPEVLRCHASALSQGGASSHCSCGRDVQCFVFLLLVEVSRMRCC